MVALFIGRFQPFHIGHLSVLENLDADPEVAKIIIGIGSSQYSETDDNPYTQEVRKKMIENVVVGKLTTPFEITAIPDIHDDERWVEHVESVVGNFDVVYTGNDWVRGLFEKKNYETVGVDIEHDISGTKLRELIKNNDETWKEYIPKDNHKLI